MLFTPFNTQLLTTCSVWKPLRGPLRDWPLAVCDAGIVCQDDLVVADQVYSKHVTENVQMQHGPRQKWYYLSNKQPDELLLFRQTNSKPGQLRGGGKSSKSTESCVLSPSGCPHSSFDNPLSGDNDLPRGVSRLVHLYITANVAMKYFTTRCQYYEH